MDSQYPIQLEAIRPVRLEIRLVPEEDQVQPLQEPELEYYIAVCDHTKEAGRFLVSMRCTVGKPDNTTIVFMQVEVAALFSLEHGEPTIEELNEWARAKASYIIYPFLRENIHSLSSRVGLDYTLPLVHP